MKPDGLCGDGFGAHSDRDGGGGRLFRVHRALSPEDATFIDDQRADDDVAEHLAGGQNLQAAGGGGVALDAAADDPFAAADVALDPTVLPYRQVAFGRQVAEHLTVEPDVGRRLQTAFELDLIAEHRLGDDRSGRFTRGSLI